METLRKNMAAAIKQMWMEEALKLKYIAAVMKQIQLEEACQRKNKTMSLQRRREVAKEEKNAFLETGMRRERCSKVPWIKNKSSWTARKYELLLVRNQYAKRTVVIHHQISAPSNAGCLNVLAEAAGSVSGARKGSFFSLKYLDSHAQLFRQECFIIQEIDDAHRHSQKMA